MTDEPLWDRINILSTTAPQDVSFFRSDNRASPRGERSVGMKLRPSVAKSEQRCAYCHDEEGALEACPGCGTLLHAECAAEGCPTLGCTRRQARRFAAWVPPVAPVWTPPVETPQQAAHRRRLEVVRRQDEDRRWHEQQTAQRRFQDHFGMARPDTNPGGPDAIRAAIARDARNMEPH